MSKDDGVQLTRRHLLRIAGATGVAMAAPSAFAAQTPDAKVANAARRGNLYRLTNDMIRQDIQGAALRVYFDLDATKTIKDYHLSKAEWQVLVRMADKGAKIEEAAGNQLPPSEKPTGQAKFKDFRTYWEKTDTCDGYTKPFPDCPIHEGGTNCTVRIVKDQDEAGYAYPKPRIDEVKPLGNGSYEVLGEGYLRDAVVRLKKDGASFGSYKGQLTGTFRCSRFTFTPCPPLEKGTYLLDVVNGIDDVEASEPVNSTSFKLEVK